MSDKHNGKYVHFTPEERPFVARVEDWIERALRRQPVCTHFLDPRQTFILQSLAVNRGVEVFFHGGYPEAERKRALLSLWHPGSLDPDDFEMALLQAEPIGTANMEIEHRHFLGSLLNIGIKREKIGDLWLLPSERPTVQVVLAAEVVDYIVLNWTKVGRVPIHVEKIDWPLLVPPRPEMEEFSVNLSSLRLDAFVAEVCRQSRAKAAQLIKEQAVKVNWQVQTEPACALQVGDLVTVRKYGRFRLLAVNGESRKGRLWVRVGKTV